MLDFRHALPPALVSGYDMAGLSTYVDADGVVRYQPHNQVLDSTNMSTNWLGSQASKASTSVSRPSNQWSDTPWKIVENTANIRHYFYNNSPSYFAGQQNHFYIVAKSAERSVLFLEIWDGAQSGVTYFDLNTGVVTPAPNITAHSMTPLGDGWWLCYARRLCANSTGDYGYGPAITSSGVNYLGDGTSGILVCAPLLAAGEQSIYVPTSGARRHLPALFDNGRRGLRLEGPQTTYVRLTENFDDWQKSAPVTVTPGSRAYPGSFDTADTIAMPLNEWMTSRGAFIPAGTAVTYTATVKVRGPAGGKVGLRLLNANTDQQSNMVINFTGADQTISFSAPITASAGQQIMMGFETRNGVVPGANVAATFKAWSAGIELGAVASSHIPNPTTSTVLRPGAQQIITGAEFSRLFPAARLGAELVVNGGFAADLTPWTQTGNGGSFAWDAGRATVAAADNRLLRQDGVLVADKRYSWTYTLPVAVTGGYADLLIGGRTTTGQSQANTYSGFTTPLSNSNVMFQAFGNVTVDNISVRELDTSVPSLQAFTLFITLADRPRPFGGSDVSAFFALNNGANYGSPSGLLVRCGGAGFVQAGGASTAAFQNGLVSGRNVIGVTVDVANRRLALSVNGQLTPDFITNLDYTGVGTTRAQLRGIDAVGNQGDGIVMHQSLEVLPLMSDAALQAECARRFALP